MLSTKGIRNACRKYNVSSHLLLRRKLCCSSSLKRYQCPTSTSLRPRTVRSNARQFSLSTRLYQEGNSKGARAPAEAEDTERVVRDAKQRFRDTLPKDYLTDEEYALYVRLYGPPLRETSPEDVGIPTHADMGAATPSQPNEGTLLRELEGGGFEEVAYEIPPKEEEVVKDMDEAVEEEQEGMEQLSEEELEALESALAEAEAQGLIEKSPNYIEAVARNQREADALQKLAEDFERAQKERKEAEELAAAEEEEEQAKKILEGAEASSWPEEYDDERVAAEDGGEPSQRFHPYTVEGSFHGNSVEIPLPKAEFVTPISDLLRRSHLDHVRKAAESKYGGAGLPLSPETLVGLRNRNMGGVGLLANHRQISEVEADAFLAAFMPAAYASIFSVIREVRRRVGGEWLQSRLKQGGEGLSVLDAGSGGAGLIAWEQVLRAEWELLKEKGEVSGPVPVGRKTVLAASDRLRGRLKTFLHDTTFLPRMPDYEHSGEMRGPRLEGGSQQQPRKSFDVIIASHQLLKEKESHRRQATLNNLWHLLKKDGGVLVMVEKAHPRGFEAVAHARDTIINNFLLPPSGEPRIAPEDFNPTYHRQPEPGHIIAPCTNQGTCPMYVEPGKSTGRKDYCHFSQRFVRPNFYTKMLRKYSDNHGNVEFSYVAVQRGVAKPASPTGKEATEAAQKGYEGSETKPDMQTLPRLILPPLKRKGHVTMDVCTPAGRIERWTVPRSFSKQAYHDARKSRWGDLWALGAKTRTERAVRHGQPKGPAKKPDSSKKKKGQKGDDTIDLGKEQARPNKPRSKQQKRLEAFEELRRVEEEEEAELEEEIGEELTEGLNLGEEAESRRRR